MNFSGPDLSNSQHSVLPYLFITGRMPGSIRTVATTVIARDAHLSMRSTFTAASLFSSRLILQHD
jgi:hypothetical protein